MGLEQARCGYSRQRVEEDVGFMLSGGIELSLTCSLFLPQMLHQFRAASFWQGWRKCTVTWTSWRKQ